jgi:phenylalanyl-tRNA synthetase beta subunit
VDLAKQAKSEPRMQKIGNVMRVKMPQYRHQKKEKDDTSEDICKIAEEEVQNN